MTEISIKTGTSSSTTHSDLFCPQLSFSEDCSSFLNWIEESLDSEEEKAVVFRSLVATVKLQPVLDDTLEAKAVKFLESVGQMYQRSFSAFLRNLHSISDDSLTEFIQSIVVLVSTPSQAITTATMEMLTHQIWNSSAKVRLAFIQADLIPQLIITLNPLSLSRADSQEFHVNLLTVISHSVWLATPNGLAELEIYKQDEQQAVHETILKHVLVPSEKYICHLCANRLSIIVGQQSKYFLELLARLLRLCPYSQQTLAFVIHMPVVLTIPSCLTSFDYEVTIWLFLYEIKDDRRKWNNVRGDQRQMWKTVDQMLRMEGIEDVIEEKLRNDRKTYIGEYIVDSSIKWNNQQGMNLPRRG